MLLNPVWIQLVAALRLSLAAVCALYIAMILGLENPYWAIVTVLVVEGVFPGMVQQRINQRMWGTLMGVILGVAILVGGSEMRFVLITMCFAAVTLTTYLALEYRAHLLMWRWVTLTVMLVVTIGLSFDTYFLTSLSRLWAMLVGVGVAWVFHTLFFPLSSAVGILFTLKKITGLLRSLPTEGRPDGQVAALAGLYAAMEQLHQLLASHALEKYGTTVRAGQARQVLDALEALAERVVIEGGQAPEFVASVVTALDGINPLAVASLPQVGERLDALCAEAPSSTSEKLLRATGCMARALVLMDMSVAQPPGAEAEAESRAYFFDSWYDGSLFNGYKAVVVGVGTGAALWLWSGVAWPSGMIMALLAMLLGQFMAFTHNLPVKALAILMILNLIVSGLLMMFVIPLIDSTGGFFLWLFIFHLLFGWLIFSPNKTLAFAIMTLLILINLSINGYLATPYAMQVSLNFGWGVAGGLLLGVITAALVKPVATRRLLQRQAEAFSEELSLLESADPVERQNLARSLRLRARMATVWWQALPGPEEREELSEPVLEMISQVPEGPAAEAVAS